MDEYIDNMKFEGNYGGELEFIYSAANGQKLFFGEYFKGKGLEYNDFIIYAGECLNGERNGKGKEYDINGKVIFEGEYFFNEKWNGIGYDKNGNKIYELINGNGSAKKYYWNGNIQYEGEYQNGKRNGKGKIYDISGRLVFEGEFEKIGKKNN